MEGDRGGYCRCAGLYECSLVQFQLHWEQRQGQERETSPSLLVGTYLQLFPLLGGFFVLFSYLKKMENEPGKSLPTSIASLHGPSTGQARDDAANVQALEQWRQDAIFRPGCPGYDDEGLPLNFPDSCKNCPPTLGHN
jgi:hypothetical protein